MAGGEGVGQEVVGERVCLQRLVLLAPLGELEGLLVERPPLVAVAVSARVEVPGGLGAGEVGDVLCREVGVAPARRADPLVLGDAIDALSRWRRMSSSSA
jgi:hypothetical protein